MRHGSESFFIEGEGLVTTQVGGRHGGAARPGHRSETPARGTTPPRRRRGAAVPVHPGRAEGHAAGGRRSPGSWPSDGRRGRGHGHVPAGYTYFGQFIDHDLTMDRTDVMLGEDVSLVDLLQARSPASTSTRSTATGRTTPGRRTSTRPTGCT